MDLVITSRLLDTIDTRIYSYLIEQKLTTLEELIRLGNHFCEAHGISKIAKPTIPTVQTAVAQTITHEAKHNRDNPKKLHAVVCVVMLEL